MYVSWRHTSNIRHIFNIHLRIIIINTSHSRYFCISEISTRDFRTQSSQSKKIHIKIYFYVLTLTLRVYSLPASLVLSLVISGVPPRKEELYIFLA